MGLLEQACRMKLAHFYHIYADGEYEGIVQDHVEAIISSELIDSLDLFAVGLVGEKHNRIEAVELLTYYGLTPKVVAEAETGWEQVTLRKVRDYARYNRAKLLYAHTKGATSASQHSSEWRKAMTHDCITLWQENVTALDDWAVSGSYWMDSKEPEHEHHHFFFGGNFWWARTDYLRTLPPLQNEHRYQAEGWIGLQDPQPWVIRLGQAVWGNFD